MLSVLESLGMFNIAKGRAKNYAAAIVWFVAVCVVAYAFYCTSKGYSFGVVASPLRVGCWR